jgi:hypothetical protein
MPLPVLIKTGYDTGTISPEPVGIHGVVLTGPYPDLIMKVQDTPCQNPAPAEFTDLLATDNNVAFFYKSFIQMKVSGRNRQSFFINSMGYLDAPAEKQLKI